MMTQLRLHHFKRISALGPLNGIASLLTEILVMGRFEEMGNRGKGWHCAFARDEKIGGVVIGNY